MQKLCLHEFCDLTHSWMKIAIPKGIKVHVEISRYFWLFTCLTVSLVLVSRHGVPVHNFVGIEMFGSWIHTSNHQSIAFQEYRHNHDIPIQFYPARFLFCFHLLDSHRTRTPRLARCHFCNVHDATCSDMNNQILTHKFSSN